MIEFESLINDVKVFSNEIEARLRKSNEIFKLYKGIRIMYSNMIFNPIVMFIGINPGDWSGGFCNSFTQEVCLEYVNEKNNRNNYTLARETREVFKNINLPDLLKTSAIKTNYFFISTSCLNHLYKITDFLGRGDNDLGELFFKKSSEWSKKLIEIIKPKIIICEGKEAFKNVTQLYKGNNSIIGWDKNYKNCGYKKTEDNTITIVGYSRRFSNIRDKKELSNLLKLLLQF